MLAKRLLTAAWSLPLVIAAIWFDGPLPWFAILAVIIGVLAVNEFYYLTGVRSVKLLTAFGLAWTGIAIAARLFDYPWAPPALLVSIIVFPLVLTAFLRRRAGIWSTGAWTVAGILYIGWFLGLLVALREQAGPAWVYLALFVTFGSDTFAYFTGKRLGRHRLAPDISPGKTWEGTIGGIIGAAAVACLFTLDTPLMVHIYWWQAVILGVLVSVFGQLGDLLESYLKRCAGVKDSGTLMPGHGGVLDRLDSVIFAGVAVYLFYNFIVA